MIGQTIAMMVLKLLKGLNWTTVQLLVKMYLKNNKKLWCGGFVTHLGTAEQLSNLPSVKDYVTIINGRKPICDVTNTL